MQQNVLLTSWFSPKWGVLASLLLIVGLSACGESQATSTSAPPASIVIHSTEVVPPLVPPEGAQGLTVTLKDSGRQVHIKPGQTILVALDDVLYDHWTILVANPSILTIQPQASLPLHAQALYKALASGQTMLTAQGDLKCAKAIPPCQIAPQDFQIQVRVE